MLAYETEVFCECGAWANLSEMEDALLLVELMELYNTTIERQSRMVQVMSSMFGGGVAGPENSGSNNNTVVVYNQEDLQNVPFGLGYEVAE